MVTGAVSFTERAAQIGPLATPSRGVGALRFDARAEAPDQNGWERGVGGRGSLTLGEQVCAIGGAIVTSFAVLYNPEVLSRWQITVVRRTSCFQLTISMSRYFYAERPEKLRFRIQASFGDDLERAGNSWAIRSGAAAQPSRDRRDVVGDATDDVKFLELHKYERDRTRGLSEDI